MAVGIPPFLDAAQILPRIYDEVNNAIQVEIPSTSPIPVTPASGAEFEVVNPAGQSLSVNVVNTLIPESYDSLALTYYSSGNGAGQVETVSYFEGGLAGTLEATLTLNYNSAGQVSSVVRT